MLWHSYGAVEAAGALGLAVAVCGLFWALRQGRRVSRLSRRLSDAGRISRLNRVLAVLSAVNEAIVRVRDRRALLDAICTAAVERGGFPLVWIGFLDGRGGEGPGGAQEPLVPAAWAGPAAEPGSRPKVDLRPFVQDKPVLCRDLGAQRGPGPAEPGGPRLRSCGVFPLVLAGRTAGAVVFYSSVPDFFDDSEVGLLEQLTADLSYALDNIETEAQRVRALDDLAAQRERLDVVTRNLGIGLAIISRDYRVLWANDVMLRLQGDAVGRLCHEGHGQPGSAGLDCGAEKVFSSGAERVEFERMGLAEDGTPYWTEIIASPLRGPDGGVAEVLEAAVPITERKILEEQLRQSQKLEAVGRLAGGMAHDFNNILTAIMGYAELIEAGAGTELRRRGYAEQIVRSADHAASLTRQLLAFSSRQVMAPRILDLNETVSEAGDLLRRLLGERVRLVARLEPSLGLVMADPVQLQQVLINLAVNARDAMPQGGTLTISTSNIAVDPSPAVLLEVSDTGEGMDEGVLSRAFEPFFTTKAKGKGTGLGLSVVFGIVKQSGGDILLESRRGAGTTFSIRLPRVEGVKSPPLAKAPDVGPPGGSETVLLVEDDERVRSLCRRLLRRQGYSVLAASDGAQALRLADRHAGPLHLLVTDMVMPGLSGREVADRLLSRKPRTRVLYISGYAGDELARAGGVEAGRAFIAKPFTRDAFLRAVREALAGPGCPGAAPANPSGRGGI